jgi:hypothetical protein
VTDYKFTCTTDYWFSFEDVAGAEATAHRKPFVTPESRFFLTCRAKIVVNTCTLISRAFGGGVSIVINVRFDPRVQPIRKLEKWFSDYSLIWITNQHGETRGGILPFHRFTLIRRGLLLFWNLIQTDESLITLFSFGVYLYVTSFTFICASDNKMHNYFLILSLCCWLQPVPL